MVARRARSRRQDLAHDQVVEQGPEGREVLLDGGQGMALLHLLDIGRHGEGNDFPQGQVVVLAPREEAAGRGGIGEAGIGIADLGGEELKQAPLGGRAGVPHRSGKAFDPPASGDQQGRRGRGVLHRQSGRRQGLRTL